MKTAFCGTTVFASALLASLIESDRAPSLVVTPPPSRAGRGRSLRPTPVATLAGDSELNLIEAADVNDGAVTSALSSLDPDAVVVCAFGQLIGPELVAAHRFLNVHPSLVPRWRGAAPIERTLLAGDTETGVAVMDLTEGLDDGPVLAIERVEVLPGDTYESLSGRLAGAACRVVPTVLDGIASGDLEAEPQDDSSATYAEKVEPGERRLTPELPAEQLDRRVRALGGRLGTYLALDPDAKERLGVVECSVSAASEQPAAGAREGEIQRVGDALLLVCANGALRLEQVKPAGGKAMSVADFLRGHEAPVRAY